jgi:hypothetical protein
MPRSMSRAFVRFLKDLAKGLLRKQVEEYTGVKLKNS